MSIHNSIQKIRIRRELQEERNSRIKTFVALAAMLFIGIFIGNFFVGNDFSITGYATGALPTVGGDSGNWGTILNNYLSQEHTITGGHKNVTVEGDLNVSGNTNLTGNLSVSGRIGIGTTNPLKLLHLTSSTFTELVFENTGAASDFKLWRFLTDTSGNFQLLLSRDDFLVDETAMTISNDGGTVNTVSFPSGQVTMGGKLTVDTNTLFVDSDTDRVGIGTITPTQKLEVGGNVNITGNLTISGNISQSTTPNANTLYAKSLPKAWVNFDGTDCASGTCTIRDSFNVDNVTNNSVGDYTIYWNRNFANANYVVVTDGKRDSSGNNGLTKLKEVASNPKTGSVRVSGFDTGGVFRDFEIYTLIAFGEQ